MTGRTSNENTRRAGAVVAGLAALVLLLGLVVALPLLLAADPEDDDSCGSPTTAVLAGSSTAAAGAHAPVGRWSSTQIGNAAAIINAGKQINAPTKAQALAVMTAMGESSLTVVDHGDTAGPDSRGLFQQRANGAWGTYAQRMNPTSSAISFYRALLRVPGWAQLTPTQAAHRTQRNADPNYYTQFWADAQRVMSALTGSTATSAVDTSATGAPIDCGGILTTSATGTVGYPVPAGSGYTDRRNWGGSGSHWVRGHTGTDLSVSCGTPVLAATAGAVIIETDQGWAGRWLVKVQTGPGRLTTWYAHMQRVLVNSGERVQPGQQIGEVGDLGNSTGCHLHFEVHPRGGSIYQDNVDPTPWLAAHVGKTLPGARIRLAAAQPGAVGSPAPSAADLPRGGFRLVSFNTLGASHTAPGGKHAGWASGTARTVGALRLLEAYRTDVAGLQEFQHSQWRTLVARGSSTFAIFPATTRADTENAIIWRRSAFQLIRAGTFAVPYFNGHTRRMPVLLLRQRSTGRTAWFANIHNPANTARYHHQGRFRAEALRRERQLMTSLVRTTGRPVFLTGDFNDRATAFCAITAGGTAASSAGGQTTPVCHPPGRSQPIDWIFGAGPAGFSGHRLDNSPNGTISDHPIVISNAHIG